MGESVYELSHSLYRVSSQELRDTGVSNRKVNAIWVTFRTLRLKNYAAVHVFSQQYHFFPYILLSSEDKDEEDFRKVYTKLALKYRGYPSLFEYFGISDRGKDICQIVHLLHFPFSVAITQGSIANLVENFYKQNFSRVSISAVHFSEPKRALQEKFAII